MKIIKMFTASGFDVHKLQFQEENFERFPKDIK